MMRICAKCIIKYYESSLSSRPMMYLCDYCNQYGDIYDLYPMAKKKKKLPLKCEDRLKRMFVVAPVTAVQFEGRRLEGPFSGPIEEIISRLKKFQKEAELVGYTNIQFREEGDYDSTWHNPYGVRPETDGEMRKRLKKIRHRRQMAKKKRLKKEIERRMKEELHVEKKHQ